MNLLGRLFRFVDRRTHDVPVADERRGSRRSRMKQADDALAKALNDLEKTVRLKREDFLPPKREVANDIQHQVQFVTFRDICSFSTTTFSGRNTGANAFMRFAKENSKLASIKESTHGS